MPSSACDCRRLHSFPTRRSSDLAAGPRRRRPVPDPGWARRRRPGPLGRRHAAADRPRRRPPRRRPALVRRPPGGPAVVVAGPDRRSEEHTSELQSRENLVCRLLLATAAVSTLSLHDALPISPLGLVGGDLCRTLGGRGDVDRVRSDAGMRLPTDLGAVLLDGVQHWFVAHLVARRSWWRGRIVDRKSTRLNSSHVKISYAVFCLRLPPSPLFPYTTLFRSRRWASSAATCAGPWVGAATSTGSARTPACGCRPTSAPSSSTASSTGSSPTWWPGGRGGGAGSSR